MSLEVRPMTIKAATAFNAQWHRRLPKLQGAMWALQLLKDGETRGVLIVGAPARLLNHDTLAVLRCTVMPDVFNGCSKLYGAAAKAAKVMGAKNFVTYTHADEIGASLRASGWFNDGMTDGGEHHRESRPRNPAIDPLPKHRWWAPWSERAKVSLSPEPLA